MSFSKRAGLAPARPLQRGSMDSRLRNGLWNCIEKLLRYIEQMPVNFMHLMHTPGMAAQECLMQDVWVEFRGAARDMFLMAGHPEQTLRQFFYQAPWNQAYDLIEFIAARARCEEFVDACNVVLEKEKAAYRIVDGNVIELSDEAQAQAIEAALVIAESAPLVHEHLRTALARLADRPDPDYRTQ